MGAVWAPEPVWIKVEDKKSLPLPGNQPSCSTHPSHYTGRTIMAYKMTDKILFTCYVVTQFTADKNMIRFLQSQTMRLKKR
jgi:flavorubredoxin